jgi:serine/threonine-protein kinase
VVALETRALDRLELETLDKRFAVRGQQSPPRDLVVVAIDDRTFADLGQRWPFPRSLHGRAMRRITSDNPVVIAYDIQFTEETTLAEDNALIEAVAASSGRVVLAASAVGLRGRSNVLGGEQLLREIDARAGNTGLPLDPGGVVRRVPYEVDGLRSFAVVAAEIATSTRVRPAMFPDEAALIDFRGEPGTVRSVSFSRLLDGSLRPGFFAGKIVVVGATTPTLHDRHPTSASPDSLMSGAEIQANAIGTVLTGLPLRHVSPWLSLALIVSLGLLITLLSLRYRMLVVAAVGVAIGALYLIAAQLLFNRGDVLPVVYPLAAIVGSIVAALGLRYAMAVYETRRMRLARGGQFAAGLEVGGYLIERQIGRGAAGTVYLATDTRLRRKVALKVLAPELATNIAFRHQFLHESQLAAALENPHVVPIYAAGETNGNLYLAMRFVPGSLHALLQRDRTLAPERALRIMAQIGNALDAAHTDGLVHRDVSPSNILLEPPSAAKAGDHAYLTDFGLAAQHGETSGEFAGKPDYASPEQIRGETLDGQADQYSLACVLYECLAGRPPFSASSEIAVIGGHLTREPPLLSELRPDLVALDPILNKALAKRADDRFASCHAFAAAVQASIAPDQTQVDSAPV